MSGQIFVSYRRQESGWSARSLYDRLCRDFDPKQIFMDIDAIALGEDFVEVIETTVAKCDVLIAVIGNNWLASKDEQGNRRLDNPEDFVRMEIGAALKRKIRVIPVLVDGASMPRPTDLLEDLKPLVRRNALLVTQTSFHGDCQRLAAAIRQVLEKTATEEQERLVAEQRQREDKERLEAKQREKARLEAEQREKERLEAEQRHREEKEHLEAEQREKERLEAEQRERESPDAKRHQHEERLEEVPQSQLPGSVTLFPPTAEPEADKSSAETPKVVHPVPPKEVIAFLAIAAVLVLAGLIYLATRSSQSPPPQPAPVGAVKPISGTPIKEEMGRRALDNATRDRPWVNSLGMKFVPVAGTQVLFSAWDTRVQDFWAFVADTDYDATGGMWSLGKDGWKQRGGTWREPGFSQGPTHPVVGVNWNDAKKFCEWLTRREQGSGMIPRGWVYRLPTDAEWSAGVGLQGEKGNNPQEKDDKIKLYPWDKEWPPPKGAGNYAGEESKIGEEPPDWVVIKGYNDGYPRTSPVGSYAANANGLYDMGGNVWQRCEDWYDATEQDRVLRGASWYDDSRVNLLASDRYRGIPVLRSVIIGFRCVVGAESSR